MSTIYKYRITTPLQQLELPLGASFLCCQAQDGYLCAWFEVDPAQPKVTRTFCPYYTGEWLDATPRAYLGTVQLGALVYHLYEIL